MFLYFLLFISLVLQVLSVLHLIEASNDLKKFLGAGRSSSDLLRRFRTSKLALLASITLLALVFVRINTVPTFQFL